jgi:hypothetical protein
MSSRCRLRDCKHTRFVRVPYAVLQLIGHAQDLKRDHEQYPMFKLKWKRRVTKL